MVRQRQLKVMEYKCNATCSLGDGQRVILCQRVRRSTRAVRAVRNTPVFLTEIRVVADAITKLNGTNHAQWETEMALVLEPKHVYGIIKGYDDKPDEPAANATATQKAAFQVWMNRNGVAKSTILLGMEPGIQVEYPVIADAKTLLEQLATAY